MFAEIEREFTFRGVARRRRAARQLTQLSGEGLHRLMTDLLADWDPDVRGIAHNYIAATGTSRRAAEAVIALLADANERVKTTPLIALRDLRRPVAVEVLPALL